ncbi:unnamed protein product, partial [Heterosigma akashiwo]
HYEIFKEEIGTGNYGVVRRCRHKASGKEYAIKSITKSKLNRIRDIRSEIEILLTVDHPNIVKLYDVFEDQTYIHLVQQLCTGGELFEHIVSRYDHEQSYGEREAAQLARCVLDAVAYCHNLGICHRDLK